MRAPLSFTLAAALVAGCNCGGPGGSGLTINVNFNQSAATCVVAGVQLEGSSIFFRSEPAVARKTKSALVFGVQATSAIRGRVVPFARGYLSSDCSRVDFKSFSEATLGPAVDLDRAGLQTVTLTLSGLKPDGGTADGGEPDGGEPDGGQPDGGQPDGGQPDGGQPDGGDAGCAAAGPEDCTDLMDNDCNGLTDCADPSCLGLTCAGLGTCVTGLDGGASCFQPIETICNDLVDNDSDTRIDCEDPNCSGQACSDGNACTTTDFCSPFPDGGGFCDAGGGRVKCSNSALDCRETLGQCVPSDGGCVFPFLDAGAACDDGTACTHTDRCGAAGACSGTAYTCTSTTCTTNAQCNGAGGCSYTFAPGTTACDDANSCTHTDRCTDGGFCSGTGYSCAAPPACFAGSACLGDGGCVWTFNGVDSGCPGGSCGPDGGCQLAAFGYPTSNFNPANIPVAFVAPATTLSGCTVAFNSTNNTFPDGGWCNQVKPTPYVFVQDGGISTTVLAMASLSVASNGTLILYGSRPVILAVFGPANIQGVIDARSLDTRRLGPGGNYSGCGAMNGRDATISAGGGGAGFGTAGGPGAGPGFGDGGVAGTNAALRPLHGGCAGGRGSDDANKLRTTGGAGGGALQISSGSTLTLDGTISTSGAGGEGGIDNQDNNGGGGGGSGGAILLEAMQLDLTSNARLTCNGGAGGGGRQDGQNPGRRGENGSLADVVPADGGQGGTAVAGDGASGAAGALGPGAATAGTAFAGSGGGGAGLGVIRLNAFTGCTIAGSRPILSGVLSKSALCP